MEATHFVLALAIAAGGLGQAPSNEEAKTQNDIFKRWWGTELNWKFDDLPAKGSVPAYRVPYSGHIWPDTAGGVTGPLLKYDRAFHGGRTLAYSYELWDANSGRETTYRTQRFGLFGRGVTRVASSQVPYWHGHCNGWSAAAIRHPEPQHSVVRNGVTFTPADIKGLLAEVYVFSQYESLAGEYTMVEPAFLHVLMANWIGEKQYPIAMEATPGKERWNFPVYAYATTFAKRGNNDVEVKMNIAYSYYANGEADRSQHIKYTKYFHYMLNLDNDGNIVGGNYYYDSSQIDLLWTALPVAPGGSDLNERGNPHINVENVMAIARDSVPEDLLAKWVNPTIAPIAEEPAEEAIAEETPSDETLAEEGSSDAEDATPSETATDEAPTETNEEAPVVATTDGEE